MDRIWPQLDAARNLIVDRLPTDRNKQIYLVGAGVSITAVVLYPLAYYWTLGRSTLHTFPNASSRSASLDCGEISSLQEDMLSNPKYYAIAHDKHTRRIPSFTVTLSPKHERIFTALLRHYFDIFGNRTPQGFLLARAFPENKNTFSSAYLQECQFREGDIVSGAFKVVKRTPLRVELAMLTKQELGPVDGLLVISLRPRGEGAVLSTETIQWTKKDNGVSLPLQNWLVKFLHDYVMKYVLRSSATKLEELATSDEV